MTLKDAAVGQTVKVKKLSGAGPVKRRIMERYFRILHFYTLCGIPCCLQYFPCY